MESKKKRYFFDTWKISLWKNLEVYLYTLIFSSAVFEENVEVLS